MCLIQTMDHYGFQSADRFHAMIRADIRSKHCMIQTNHIKTEIQSICLNLGCMAIQMGALQNKTNKRIYGSMYGSIITSII